MGNWWDEYIPGVALFDNSQANDQKAAIDAATAKNDTGTQNIANFYSQQQAKALAFYKPLQDMFASQYGTQGVGAPTYANPMGSQQQAPTKPLAAMYGGPTNNAAVVSGQAHGGR